MSIRYASKQEELYHIILENLPEGVNVVDTEGYIIYSNISSGKYANANPADMVGKHVTVYFPRAALVDVLRTRTPVYDLKTECPKCKKLKLKTKEKILEYPTYTTKGKKLDIRDYHF